ncbi:MAG: hypothetical protein QM639_04685 [Rhodocyclaceae bacterium]
MRWLHYIDDHGLQSWRATQGGVRHESDFPAGEGGAHAFAHWLRAGGRHGTHTILVDIGEEDFKQESIPHVVGADRKALLERKIQQHFFGTPYAASLSLGRETEGRRDERILHAALTRPQQIEPWLGALRMHEVAVTALVTPPLLTAPLLAQIRPTSARGLLITVSPAGIRQTYFEDGQLRFSRLSPHPVDGAAQWGAGCLYEAQKLHQYLIAQRWLPRGTRLAVWALLHRRDAAQWDAMLDADQFEFHAIDIEELARHTGVREQPADSDVRPILMRLALRAKMPLQMAPAADTRYFKLRCARNAIAATGLLSFALLAAAALTARLDARALQAATAQAQLVARDEAHRYDALVAKLPELPASLATLRDVVSGFDAASRQSVDVIGPLNALSRTLDRFPDVELERLDWRMVPVSGGSADATTPATARPAWRQWTTADAHLPSGSAADPRAALGRVRDFAAALRQDTGGDVLLPRLPFDAESDKTLRSDAASTTASTNFQVRFSLPGERR